MKRLTKEEARKLFLEETMYLENGYCRTYKGTIPMNWYNEFVKQYGKPVLIEEYGNYKFMKVKWIKA